MATGIAGKVTIAGKEIGKIVDWKIGSDGTWSVIAQIGRGGVHTPVQAAETELKTKRRDFEVE